MVVKLYPVALLLMLGACSEHAPSYSWLYGIWIYDKEQTEQCFAEYSVDIPPEATRIMLSTELVITKHTFDALEYVLEPAPEGLVRVEFKHPTHPGYHIQNNGDGICLHTISFGNDFETICMACFKRSGDS